MEREILIIDGRETFKESFLKDTYTLLVLISLFLVAKFLSTGVLLVGVIAACMLLVMVHKKLTKARFKDEQEAIDYLEGLRQETLNNKVGK